jgi:cation diffusion facilitator family transporter
VWTSVGVLVAVAAVGITGWLILDPLIALVVAANIVRTALILLRHSALALLDLGLPRVEREEVQSVLDRHLRPEGLQWHALRTRQAGRRRFISVHVLVPGEWTVQRGHALLETVEEDLRALWPMVTVFTHLEPLEDPRSFEDATLDRAVPRKGSGDNSHLEEAARC